MVKHTSRRHSVHKPHRPKKMRKPSRSAHSAHSAHSARSAHSGVVAKRAKFMRKPGKSPAYIRVRATKPASQRRRCSYKGTEPSPKGLGRCARNEKSGTIVYGRDGRRWIVSPPTYNRDGKELSGRWVPYH
jgi:hypothetical protein